MMKNESKDEEKTYIGHRSRARALVLENGVESLPEYQILEYLLFHAIPRKDTKGIAYSLLDKFGTFADVLLADVNELAAVPNMTENAALLLHSLPGLFTAYQKSKSLPKTTFNNHTALPYIKSLFDYETVESLYLLCFDAKKQLTHVDKISDGTSSNVPVSVKKITEIVFRHHAHSVLLAHNHPSENPSPSNNDLEVTTNLHRLLDSMDITVIDHIIVGSDYAFSFAMNTRLRIKDGFYPINNIKIKH